MGKINVGMDVGIPLGVGVVDVVVAWWDEKRIAQNAAAMPFEPIFGPVAAMAGIGMMAGNFYAGAGQVITHSSLPLAVRSVWSWAKGQGWFGGVTQRFASRAAMPQMAQAASPMRRVGYGYPAPSEKPEFSFPPAY